MIDGKYGRLITMKDEITENEDKKGAREKDSDAYIKTALYVYPALRAAAREVSEHIQRKACLSYVSRTSCENLATYLIGQIGVKEKLEELRKTLGEILDKLSDTERFLLYVRYFGNKKKFLSAFSDEAIRKICGSRRSYYRRQERLVRKIGEGLRSRGMTADCFYREYGTIDLIRNVDKALAAGRRGAQGAREEQVILRLAK